MAETEEYEKKEWRVKENEYGTKVCRYNWHSAGSPGWTFPTPKYKYIFKTKNTEAILSDSTRKQLWIEFNNILIAV